MKSFTLSLALIVSSFAYAFSVQNAAPTDTESVPNIICAYLMQDQSWKSWNHAINLISTTETTYKLGNVGLAISESQGGFGIGACHIDKDQTSFIRLVRYHSDLNMNIDPQPCAVPAEVKATILQDNRAEVTPGGVSMVETELEHTEPFSRLKFINYFLTAGEHKSWAASEEVSQTAAAKKCLELLPGAVPLEE